jgi:hypothetical protein
MVQKELENFLNDFGKGFWNGMMEGEKMESHQKGFLKSNCFSPLKILASSLFEETLGAFLSLPLSFFCSVSWVVLMLFEEKITSSKTSFQMASIYWQWVHIPEWSYARQYFWGRLANNVGSKSFSIFFSKLK